MAQRVKNPLAMWEIQVQSLGQEDLLEKGKATHSSVLAWRIPWTEKSDWLQFMGLQRVRHGEQLSMQAWKSLKVLTLGFLHPSDTMSQRIWDEAWVLGVLKSPQESPV